MPWQTCTHMQLRPHSSQVPQSTASSRCCLLAQHSSLPASCQTGLTWPSPSRVNGSADFGQDMITNCFPDLGSSSRESHSKTAAFPPCSSIRHTENTFLHAGGTDDIQGSVFLQAEDQEGSSPTSEMPSGALWEHRVTAEQSARMLRSQQLPLDHSSGGSAAQVGSDLSMFPSLFLPHSASTNHWHSSPPLVRV